MQPIFLQENFQDRTGNYMAINLTSTLLTAQNLPAKQQAIEPTQFKKLDASSSVTVSVDQNPLTLAYQAAIDRINEAVAPYLGDDAISRGYDSGIDVTPEATADRIVSLSTALLSRFQSQRPDSETEATINQFVDTIQEGIERGFSEAKEILSSLGVLQGELETNVEKTLELTIKGLADFRSTALTSLQNESNEQ
jgi:hypothetical protein